MSSLSDKRVENIHRFVKWEKKISMNVKCVRQTNIEIIIFIFWWLLRQKIFVKKLGKGKMEERVLKSKINILLLTSIAASHLSPYSIVNYARSFDHAKPIHPNIEFVKKICAFLVFLFLNLSFHVPERIVFFTFFQWKCLEVKKKAAMLSTFSRYF